MSSVVREFEQGDDVPGRTPLEGVEFAVVDVETTGTGARRGQRVTEVAVVVVRGREVRPVFETLVNPGQPIPWMIAQLTGITDRMVRDAPAFPDIAGELAGHLAGRVFVAHNAAFDWAFLEAEFARVTTGGMAALAPAQLCTVRLARRLLRHLPRRNLDALCAHYDIAITRRHRAGGDALATARALVGLVRDAERAGIWSLEGLLKHGRRRVPGKRRTAMPTWSDGADGA